MPFLDWFRLAARGVMRRKLRALSSAIGVIAATTLLAITVAGGQGIMAALQTELETNPWLRRIQVMPIYEQNSDDVPDDVLPEIDVEDEELKERLRQRYRQGWARQQVVAFVGGISVEEVNAFRKLDGVAFAQPGVQVPIEVRLAEAPAKFVRSLGVRLEDKSRRARIVVSDGRVDDERPGIVLSEFAAYEMGFVDPSQWQQLIGQNIEIHLMMDHDHLALRLQSVSMFNEGSVSVDDLVELKEWIENFPELLAESGLSEEQIELFKVLSGLGGEARDTEGEASLDEGNSDVDESDIQPVVLNWPIVGIFRDPTEDEMRRIDWTERSQSVDAWLNASATDKLIEQLPVLQKNGFYEIRVDVAPGYELRAVQDAIEERGWSTYSMADFVDYLMGQVRAGGAVFLVVTLAIFAVCALNIFNTQTLAVMERTYEIGILKAIGARTWEILGVFLLETMTLGLVSSQIGWLIAWLIGRYVESMIESRLASAIDVTELGAIFSWSFGLWLLVTCVGTLICGLAALIPARHAARVDPIHALRTR